MNEAARLMVNSKTKFTQPEPLKVEVAKPEINFDKVSNFIINAHPVQLEVDLEQLMVEELDQYNVSVLVKSGVLEKDLQTNKVVSKLISCEGT